MPLWSEIYIYVVEKAVLRNKKVGATYRTEFLKYIAEHFVIKVEGNVLDAYKDYSILRICGSKTHIF